GAEAHTREIADDFAIDRKANAIALRADFVVVPLAGGLDAIGRHFLAEIEALDGAAGEIRAEQIAAAEAGLGLHPKFAVAGEADADAAVVARLLAAGARGELPVHGEHEIADRLIVAEPFVAAIAGADEGVSSGVDAPLELRFQTID